MGLELISAQGSQVSLNQPRKNLSSWIFLCSLYIARMSNKSPFVTPLCDQKTVNAGAVLQSPPSLINSLIHSLTDPLVHNLRTLSIPSRKSWEGDILRECSLPPCVTCHMSYVMCHMSHIMCHNSHVTCHMSHCHMSHFYLFYLTKCCS